MGVEDIPQTLAPQPSYRGWLVWAGIGVLIVVILLGFFLTNKADQGMVVPILNDDGTIGYARMQSTSLFASLVRPIFNSQGLLLTQFDEGETPITIGPAQPEDVIAFTCPAGSNIIVNETFSRYPTGDDMWLWGPYVGDEGQRLSAGEDPNVVFSGTKFGGKATGFFDNSIYILTQGLYFSSSMVPAGSLNHVRCAAVLQCGDFFLDPPEECDDGTGNSDTLSDRCRSTDCKNPFCGDGVTDTGIGEACDDGIQNGQLGMCNAQCTGTTVVECGNGIVEPPDETCDDGTTCADNTACTVGADCSDGSTCILRNTDGCLVNCTPNVPGDGFVNTVSLDPGFEECDDGKTCGMVEEWCESDADCSTPGDTCSLRDDGCLNAGGLQNIVDPNDPSVICQLQINTLSPISSGQPERSLCSFGAPGPGAPSCPNAICDLGEVCAADCSVETHCSDGVDNDQDGFTDGLDTDCIVSSCLDGICDVGEECEEDCTPEPHCSDGVDNDEDGFTDGEDSDCSSSSST